MKKSFTGQQYLRWNLIDTGKVLFAKFVNANVILIRADTFYLNTFAKYFGLFINVSSRFLNFLLCLFQVIRVLYRQIVLVHQQASQTL